MAFVLKMRCVLFHMDGGIDRAQKTQKENEWRCGVYFSLVRFHHHKNAGKKTNDS
jgi:hypothetical protein